MLTENTKVKDFTLKDENGKDWTFSENLGKKFVIYFYPKDETPGCTTQACEFRDSFHHFERIGVDVIGISADSVESHKAFKENHNLPFTLLADEEREVIAQFGGFSHDNILDKAKMKTMRATFIIDEEGKIEKVYEKASPAKGAGDIIDYLTA